VKVTNMEKEIKEELNSLIDRGFFARAEQLAQQLDLNDKVQELRRKALWQMAAANRNMPGTKKLAEFYGFTRDQLKSILEETLGSEKIKEDNRILDPCYDQYTGQYLSFEEWINQLFKRWDKIGRN